MFPVLFSVAMMIGALSAIRHNPAYSSASRTSVVRSIAIILLAIGAMIGVIVAAVRLTENRSTAVAGATIAAVIVFGCFFLIYVIVTVSTSKAAKLVSALPPGVKAVHVHRHRVYRWAKVLGVLVLFFAILGLMIPGNAKYAAFTIAAFTLFLGIVLLPILYMSMRMMDVSLTALEADPWVHWTYSAEQWAQWSQVQVARVQAVPPFFIFKRDWHKIAWPFALTAAGVYVFVPGGWLWKTIYLAFILAMLIAIPLLSEHGAKGAPERLRARLAQASPEVYFGRDGVYCDGTFTNWLTTGVFLTAASIDDRAPRSLLFQFEKDVPNPYGPMQTIRIDQAVLIPPGKERDIALLQTKLTGGCPTAQIALG